ncbi:MAG: hypothetical protein J6A44_02970 [Paludibacteraceae bacterium]|nr:hypothetical protein [Paludibacteraceae bacterium]
MKKNKIIILALSLLFCVGTLPAQSDDANVEKKEKKNFVLPQAGDISLGIDVVPMLSYFGNFFNGTMGNGYSSFGGEQIVNPVTNPTVSIMGKYMITDNIAARVNIGFLYTHNKYMEYSLDDAARFDNPLSEAEVIDQAVFNATGASFSLGAEYRRGYKWIQGFAGLNFIYGFSENNYHFSYGNAITEINQLPSRYDWGVTSVVAPSYWNGAYLLDMYNDVSTQFVGLGAHVGVECFMTSYLSLGGEVFINALWEVGAAQYARVEGFNIVTNVREERIETINPGYRAFTLGTQNLGGKLYLSFYF